MSVPGLDPQVVQISAEAERCVDFTPDEDRASYVTSAWPCLCLELCQYQCRWLADLGIWGWHWAPSQGLEGAALCCRNLQCRSGPGMVLSACLEGDFAELMLSFCIPVEPCGAQLCINKFIYVHTHTPSPKRAGRSLASCFKQHNKTGCAVTVLQGFA